jgi:hypothetical protein
MYIATTKSSSNKNGFFFAMQQGWWFVKTQGKPVFFLLSHIQHNTSDRRRGDFFPQTQAITSPADTNWVS